MAGRVGNGPAELGEAGVHEEAEAAAAEPLPAELEPEVSAGVREIVLGRNVHASCFAVKEPDADDEDTGEREATMAAVLARYRRSLTERTKHHLGILPDRAFKSLNIQINCFGIVYIGVLLLYNLLNK
jgi:histidine decarboxylase